jgi:hypothetical protein
MKKVKKNMAKVLDARVGEWWGLIVEGECVNIRWWSEVCKEIHTKKPQVHDFPDGWQQVSKGEESEEEKEYEIRKIQISW